jgi:thiamine biosynthesis lipoprotein
MLLQFSNQLLAQKNPVKISGYTQGTTYSITYYDKQNRNFQPEIEKLFKAVDHSLSLWDSSSIICSINSNKAEVLADEYLKNCYDKAMEVCRNTNGAFDITVGPLVNYWGFGLKNRSKTDSAGVDSIMKFVGYRLVEMQDHKIIKKDNRVKLDFNGLAQGYTTDLVSRFLETKNITKFIVEIGGEVYAKNKKPNGESWRVGIETPDDNSETNNPLIAIAKLENKALSTSGSYRKFYIIDGKRYSHSINPMTGYPAMNNLLSVSVFADDCITADAYATSFMVMGYDATLKFLEKHKEIQVVMITATSDGKYKMYQSSALKDIVNPAK